MFGVNSKIGLRLLKSMIEDKLKKRITDYKVLIQKGEECMSFVVDGKTYPYKDATFSKAMNMAIKNNLKKGSDFSKCEIYYFEKSEPFAMVDSKIKIEI